MIRINNINIHYDHEVLKSCDISLYDGTFTLIKGESGAGKSSLLYRIGLISSKQDFDYQVMDHYVKSEQEKEMLRKIHFGYVLQDSALFDHYDVLGNLQLYATISGLQYTLEEYKEMLGMVHLECDLHQSIVTLSGGERQRLAIACALCKQADVLVLDEVTSSLDEENEQSVLEVLKEMAEKYHRCIVLASHSKQAIPYADVIYEIQQQTLVCTKHQPGETQTWKQRTSSLSFQFYQQYLQYFFKKYAQLNRSIIAIMSLAIFILFTAFGLFQYYTKQSMQEFTSMYQNQAFITYAYYQDRVDDVLMPLSKEQESFLNNLSIQAKRYPLISAQILVNGTPVWILPCFDASFYEDKFAIEYQKDGIIMSKEAYDLFQSEETKITTSVIVNEVLEESTLKHEVKDTINIRGILKQTVTSPYMRGDYFIYMNYEDMETLYQANASSTLFLGYTVVSKDYHVIQQIEDALYDVPMGLNTSFCDTKTMAAIDQSVAWVKGVSIIMVSSIFFLMLFAFQMKYLYSRNKEFALLKINGMSNQNIGILLLWEALFKYGLALLFSIILTGAVNLVLILFGISALLPSLLEIGFIMVFSFFVCVVAGWIVSVMKVNKLSPENILRN